MTDQQTGTTTRTRRSPAKDKPTEATPAPLGEVPDLPQVDLAECVPVYREDGSVVAMVPKSELPSGPSELFAGVLLTPTPQATIHQLMARVLSELPAIGKNQVNTQQNFNFRGIDDVLNALNPLLSKYGVFFVPDVIERVSAQRTTSRQSIMYEVNLHVRFTFYGPSGDTVTGSAWGEGTDMGDKATNKAMTQAMKAMLFQAFAVNTDETKQDDPDRTTMEDTVDPDAAAREAGWPDRATAAAAHEALAARVRARTEEGLITADNAKALKEMGLGWPMTKADFDTYEQQCKEIVQLNKELKAAEAAAVAADQANADTDARDAVAATSEVG